MVATAQTAKSLAKQILPRRMLDELRRFSRLIGYYPQVPFDNTYPWLSWAFSQVYSNGSPHCRRMPQYIWGTAQGAALARVLGETRISVIEFGVAQGAGLIALESIAKAISELTDIGIDVFGFDTGTGLPPPIDFRDQPNMWYAGQLPMDKKALLSRLTTAKLYLGPVKDTLHRFIDDRPSPIAFASFDMDLYSSTRDALKVFEANHDLLLPRVFAYFDDLLGDTYNDFCGERLAIREFNSKDANAKICPIHGLRYFVPPRACANYPWPEGMHIVHMFKHKRYNSSDSINKPTSIDIEGMEVWGPPRLDSEMSAARNESPKIHDPMSG